jgi:hypothetical protein
VHQSLTLADYPRAMVHIQCDKCGGEGCAAKPPDHGADIALPKLRHAKAARAKIGNLCRFRPLRSRISKNKVSVMTANNVTPFEVFKSFVEFYPKLGATIAFGAMAAAARMIPTSGAAISDAPQAEGPELVSPVNISTPRKRSSVPRKRSTAQQPSARKRSTPLKTRRKASKRATGRRKAA